MQGSEQKEISGSFTQCKPFRCGPLNSISVTEVNPKGNTLTPKLSLGNVDSLKDKCYGKLWV